MEKIEVKDRLNFICDKSFTSIVPQDESLIWSGDVLKINCKGTRQTRDFIITDQKVYNLGKKGNFLVSLFSKPVKRCFKISDVKAITYSAISNNFIMHIPNEYDYYLCTPDKDEFVKYILYVQSKLGVEPLKFYTVEDIDLFKFNRYEGQKVEKFPSVVPEKMDFTVFEGLVKKKKKELEDNINNTEIIVSGDGSRVNENSFEILKTLGKGYFGRVFLVEKKESKELYALKVISKLDIIKRNFFENLKSEKNIMQTIRNPFVVNYDYCFASPSYVFFAMKFKQGGELYFHLRKMTRFSESMTKFYACQILQGLAYLHSKNIVYRDMKPENILLDERGNACLADFGISKILDPKETTKSFVGTPEYVAPEIVLQKGHNKTVDIWCFGVLLYEMVFGIPPFYNKNQNVMLNWVVKLEPTFPKMIKISDELANLITQVE
jgi:serum/glucocorticoid-regulated kinase 2